MSQVGVSILETLDEHLGIEKLRLTFGWPKNTDGGGRRQPKGCLALLILTDRLSLPKVSDLAVPGQHEVLNSFTSERRVVQRQSGQSAAASALFSMAWVRTDMRRSQPVTRRDS